jgi:hypothetical protein
LYRHGSQPAQKNKKTQMIKPDFNFIIANSPSFGSSFTEIKNCRCIIPVKIHSAVQPSIKPIPEARYYSDSTSAIELWLSVPRLLGV